MGWIIPIRSYDYVESFPASPVMVSVYQLVGGRLAQILRRCYQSVISIFILVKYLRHIDDIGIGRQALCQLLQYLNRPFFVQLRYILLNILDS